jgi:hypothetical protein
MQALSMQGVKSSIKRGLFLSLFIILLLHPVIVEAAAWVHEKGKGLSIKTVSLYQAPSYFDHGGNKRNQSAFSQFALDNFWEKGISNRFTLGVLGSTVVNHQQQDTLVLVTDEGDRPFPTIFNVSEIAVWGRYLLSQSERSALSFQPLLKLPPIYTGEGNTGANTNTAGAELRFLFGHSFSYKERWHYVNLEGAYKEYFDDDMGGIDIDMTLGSHLSEKWEVMGQVFNSFRKRSFVYILGKSPYYDLTKVQFSGVYHINQTNSLQLGVYGDVAGKNTGAGMGVMFGIWKRF